MENPPLPPALVAASVTFANCNGSPSAQRKGHVDDAQRAAERLAPGCSLGDLADLRGCVGPLDHEQPVGLPTNG